MRPPERQEPEPLTSAPAPAGDQQTTDAPAVYTRPEDATADDFAARVLRGDWHQIGLIVPADSEGGECD